MIANTKKTVYVVLHDAENFGETPILKMEIHCRGHISHKQLIGFRHNLEIYINDEMKRMQCKPEYSGTFM